MEHRKHRFTLFLGYGEQAGSLLKRFEQVKCSLGISTNLLFLRFLLEYFEQHHNNSAELTLNSLDIEKNDHIKNAVSDSSDVPNQNTITTVKVDDLVPKEIQNIIDDTSVSQSNNIQNNCDIESSHSSSTKIDGEFIHTAETCISENIAEPCNTTHIEIINRYMEHTKKELNYYHGYVSSGEKLRQFLDEYRRATNMCFTVRSSRSYIKKRALNAVKNCGVPDSDVVMVGPHGTIVIPGETGERDDTNEQEAMTCHDLSTTIGCSNKKTILSINQQDKENSSVDTREDPKMVDCLITGPLRWEYILGKPSIPFTGVPFCIIGNTHYQCFYACADIRTLKKKEGLDVEEAKENPNPRKRRRSMKRDCKAVMCIKSIVTFPEFTVEDIIAGVTSKKGCRKIKAAALERVRTAVVNGETVGHPAFWISIPLPEAHTSHDLNETQSNLKEQYGPPSESMDPIAHILDVAAQYGGKVQILQKGEQNIIEFQLNETTNHEEVDVTGVSDVEQNEDASSENLLPFKVQETCP